jgi:hypothetical protein
MSNLQSCTNRTTGFVKAIRLTTANAQFLLEPKESIEEVNQAKAGKLKLKSAADLLNEL